MQREITRQETNRAAGIKALAALRFIQIFFLLLGKLPKNPDLAGSGNTGKHIHHSDFGEGRKEGQTEIRIWLHTCG